MIVRVSVYPTVISIWRVANRRRLIVRAARAARTHRALAGKCRPVTAVVLDLVYMRGQLRQMLAKVRGVVIAPGAPAMTRPWRGGCGVLLLFFDIVSISPS